MSTTLTEISIITIKEFTAFAEDILQSPNEIAWYRGVGKRAYELKPSLYRRTDITNIIDLLDLEKQIISRFKQRSIPYLTRPLTDDWDNLFFMQHYRVPTRLLDWTEHPYIALYFALTSAPFDKDTSQFSDDAAIWVLNPVLWNQKALQHLSFKGGILSQEAQQVKNYFPVTDLDMFPENPLAIYGSHNSPRIVAQRGVFTIFGKNLNSMENIYVTNEFPQDSLRKLILPKESIPNLLKSIISIGYTDSVIFPDLEGLAKELKRFFRFEV
jgi:hypothetical protein